MTHNRDVVSYVLVIGKVGGELGMRWEYGTCWEARESCPYALVGWRIYIEDKTTMNQSPRADVHSRGLRSTNTGHTHGPPLVHLCSLVIYLFCTHRWTALHLRLSCVHFMFFPNFGNERNSYAAARISICFQSTAFFFEVINTFYLEEQAVCEAQQTWKLVPVNMYPTNPFLDVRWRFHFSFLVYIIHAHLPSIWSVWLTVCITFYSEHRTLLPPTWVIMLGSKKGWNCDSEVIN